MLLWDAISQKGQRSLSATHQPSLEKVCFTNRKQHKFSLKNKKTEKKVLFETLQLLRLKKITLPPALSLNTMMQHISPFQESTEAFYECHT